MSNLAANGFERNLSGMRESIKVVRGMARLAIGNDADPRVMANQIDQITDELKALASEIRTQALDPFYDNKHAFVLNPVEAAAERSYYGSNSG